MNEPKRYGRYILTTVLFIGAGVTIEFIAIVAYFCLTDSTFLENVLNHYR